MVQSLDNYGTGVSLNFRGQDRYKTTRGGLITIISYIVVLLLGFELVQRWVTRQDPVVSSYEVFGETYGKYDLKENYQHIMIINMKKNS